MDYRRPSPYSVTSPQLPRYLSKDPVHYPRDPPPEAHPAHCASLHLSVDHQLPDPALTAPQECILSTLLFSLYTNDCTSWNPSVKLLKFGDDTTVSGLIRDAEGRWSSRPLGCGQNHLELNPLVDCKDDSRLQEKLPSPNSALLTITKSGK